MAEKMPQIVCIGRQYGSGGREVGERLAKLLNIPCYDKVLVTETAIQSGLSEAFVKKEDETPGQSRWFLSGNPFADNAALTDAFYSGSQVTYDVQRDIIRQLAQRGPCVFVGRCAAAILNRSDVLSVFIYANEEDCVARVMQRNGLSAQDAAKRIRQVNRMRKKYHAFYADSDWGQPDSYDLMLSTSKLGIDGCVELLRDALNLPKEGASHE